MTIRLLAFILSILLPTMAPAASGPNEPSGFTTVSDFNFDSRCANGWVCVYPSGQIVQDSTAPISLPNVLQYAWRNHSFSDVSYTYYSFPAGTAQFYIALWWKPSNPFYGWPTVQQQKIMLLEGTHTYFSMFRSAGIGASSVYGLWNSVDLSNNNGHIPGGGVGELLYPNVNGMSVALGQWHRLEWQVKASTTASSRDGILRWWMDGQLMANYTNVNTAVRTFQSIMLAPVWDAPVQEYSSFTDYHSFDHVHLSVGSGGGGGSDNPPGPPNTPTITSVTVK